MTDMNMQFTTGDTISFDYKGKKEIEGTITGETKQFFKIQDYEDNDKTYRIKKNNKSFKFCYHINDKWADGAGFDIKEGKYTIHMCGGCAEWWNYVIDKTGVYVENTNGLTKIDGKLISCPEGNYLSDQPEDYKFREGETDMFDMIQECFIEEIMEYEKSEELKEIEEELKESEETRRHMVKVYEEIINKKKNKIKELEEENEKLKDEDEFNDKVKNIIDNHILNGDIYTSEDYEELQEQIEELENLKETNKKEIEKLKNILSHYVKEEDIEKI
jgi:hypothetical protein